MKDFIIKHWQIAVIIGLVGFISISGLLSNCTGKQVEDIVSQADVDTQLNKQKADLEAQYLLVNGEILKALQASEKKISDGLKPRIIIRKEKAATLVEAARKDTATTALCDSALNAQEQLIFDMETKAYSDSIQLDISGRRLALKDSINKVITASNTEQIRINGTLNKAVIKANKGKNTKWYFLAIGAAASYLFFK